MAIVIFILLLYVAQANALRVPEWIIAAAWIVMAVRFTGWLVRVYGDSPK